MKQREIVIQKILELYNQRKSQRDIAIELGDVNLEIKIGMVTQALGFKHTRKVSKGYNTNSVNFEDENFAFLDNFKKFRWMKEIFEI